jgi:hypothetical protein
VFGFGAGAVLGAVGGAREWSRTITAGAMYFLL